LLQKVVDGALQAARRILLDGVPRALVVGLPAVAVRGHGGMLPSTGGGEYGLALALFGSRRRSSSCSEAMSAADVVVIVVQEANVVDVHLVVVRSRRGHGGRASAARSVREEMSASPKCAGAAADVWMGVE
jgi:hypothetical protein